MTAERKIIDCRSGIQRRADRLRRFGAPALVPVSWIYQVGANAVRAMRAVDEREHVGAKVVSVGNLEVGGNGKTPMAMHLLEGLAESGQRPVFVSRGYGVRRDGMATVVGNDGFPVRPLAGARYVDRRRSDLWRVIGDEPAMVAMRVAGVPVVVCSDKQKAVTLASRLDATHIVVDDAFQSWGLARDLDIVMLDARRPFGDGRLLPAGTLREPPDALSRADWIVLNGVDGEGPTARALGDVKLVAGTSVPVVGARRSIRIVDAVTLKPVSHGASAVSVCGVARPDRFETQLLGAGVDIDVSFRFDDHHVYVESDVEAIEARRPGVVVTTEKDWVKLSGMARIGEVRWCLAQLTLTLHGGDPLGALLE